MTATVKLLVAALAGSVAIAITFTVLWATDDSGSGNVEPAPQKYTVAEIEAAARVLGNMDTSVEPCEDFYKYACGGWEKKTVLSSTVGRYSIFDAAEKTLHIALMNALGAEKQSDDCESIKKAKDFYASCMDSAAIEADGFNQLRVLVESLGYWPMADGSTNSVTWTIDDWATQIMTFSQKSVASPLIRIYVGEDLYEVVNHLAAADQPGLLLGSETYYTTNADTPRNQDLKAAYINLLTDVATYFCQDMGSDSCEGIADKAALVYEMENQISGILVPRMERKADDSLTFHKVNVADFQTNKTTVGPLVTAMLKIAFGDAKVTDSFIFNDVSEPYFLALDSWLGAQNQDIIQDFMMFRTIAGYMDSLPEKYLAAQDRFNRVVIGTVGRQERYVTCTTLANNAFTMPVGAMYVAAAFPAEAKVQTDVMITNVIDTFENVILDEQNDWMDETTKGRAHEKARAMSRFIGYPDYIMHDQGRMDDDYNDYTVTAALLTDVVYGNTRKYAEDFAALDTKTDLSKWATAPVKGHPVGPAIVNAWYCPTRNSITFPAGILQAPFFDVGQSVAINYGAIGMVIGHELTHGFDDQGAHYDSEGNKKDWWLPETKEQFEIRAADLASQYNNYTWEQAGTNLNGDAENGENIADNGGIRETFYAYKKWQETNTDKVLPGMEDYTFEQQLFIGYAQVWCAIYTDEEANKRVETDVHAPGPFRVLGPLANFDEFWKTFQCQPGQGYYPPNKQQDHATRVW